MYQTSPALCNPITPFPTGRRIACAHNFPDSHLRLPGILNDPFCCMTLLVIEWSLLQRTRQRQLQRRLPIHLNGSDNPKNFVTPWDFVTLPEEDRATATGNMCKKIDKDRACGFGDTLSDRQTDRHTHTCSSQYFATAPAGEVNISQSLPHIVVRETDGIDIV